MLAVLENPESKHFVAASCNIHNFQTTQPTVMKFGHEVDKQVSYKFVIGKFSIKHRLQVVPKQLLSATQKSSRKDN